MRSLRVVSLASALLLAAACNSGSVTAPVEAARPRFDAASTTGGESERGTGMLGTGTRTEEAATTQGTTTGTETVSDTTGTGTTTERGTSMLGSGG